VSISSEGSRRNATLRVKKTGLAVFGVDSAPLVGLLICGMLVSQPAWAAETPTADHSLAIFIAQVVLLLTVGRLLGEAMERIGQPAVMGQLLAGILLGPSLFGLLAPSLHTLVLQVITQTERRVFKGEKVPASDKCVSLFEPHTDIIVKGRREVQYGHKLNLVSGRSGLILDVVIEPGNPADSQRFMPMLERHQAHYGVMPRQVHAFVVQRTDTAVHRGNCLEDVSSRPLLIGCSLDIRYSITSRRCTLMGCLRT
jgi:hypothetical protein